MSPTRFIGIDPGYSGGIALITSRGAEAVRMPDTERDTWEQLEYWVSGSAFTVAAIEKVHSMPKQGVASSFKFGTSYGGLRMALIASKVSFVLVTPQKWQKALGCLTKGDKNVTKVRAQELWPHIKVTHAIADALLIAEYLRQTWQPGDSL